MADTVYIPTVTLITADTMNDLNRLHYTILGDPADASAALTGLGVSTYAKTILDDTTATAACTTLGAAKLDANNAFTGQTVTQTLSTNGAVTYTITNANTGSSAYAMLKAASDAGNVYIQQFSTAGGGEAYLYGSPSGGLVVGVSTATGIKLKTNALTRFTAGSAGQWGIGTSPDYGTLGQSFKSGGTGAAPSWGTAIAQVVNYQTGAVATGTTNLPHDDTIPQNTEGDEYMTLAITPKATTNKLKIEVVFQGTLNINEMMSIALFQDTTANAIAAVSKNIRLAACPAVVTFTHYMSAGTTSATTFKVRAGGQAGATLTFNGLAGGRIFGGVGASSITITEITP